jgi:nitrite reductase (NADH) small subunit
MADPIHLGSIDAIPLGQGRCFVVAGEEVAVFRQRDGKLFAVQNRCPHRQGPLAEGILGAGKVICPLHGHKFDLATGTGSEPAECVRAYPVEVRNGEIWIQFQPPPRAL